MAGWLMAMADGHQPSATSHQPSAISHQPSAISHQPSAISHQPSAISHQPSAISHQPSAMTRITLALLVLLSATDGAPTGAGDPTLPRIRARGPAPPLGGPRP